MKRMILLITTMTWLLAVPEHIFAQTDPGRVLVITNIEKRGKKTLEAQVAAQGLNTTGHIWTEEEVRKTLGFEKQFYEYLDSFQNILSYAAEIYGIYYEVKQTSKNMNNISELVAGDKVHPENVLAVAISAKRGAIYGKIVRTSLDIINDIRMLIFSGNLTTEQERLRVLGSIRPKLRKFNMELRDLAFALRYTSLLDVWREVMGTYYKLEHASRKDIPLRCRRDWIDNAKAIHAKSTSN